MAKIGRNDPCPCGSGKKYKKCHGSHISDGELMKNIKANGFHVSQDFNDRRKLSRVGPVIKAEWRVPPEIEIQLGSKGAPIPTPVKG